MARPKGSGAKKPPAKTGRGKTLNAKAAMQEAQQAAAEKVDNAALPVPSTNDVVNLARRCKALKKQGAEVTGQIGEMIAQAVEKKHLDRKAFGMARQLDAMSDDKLRVTYRHLLKYIDDLGVAKRATAQGDMFEEEDEEGAGEPAGAEAQGADDNVVRSDFARRQKESQGENYGRQVPVAPRAVNETAGA